MQRITPTDRRGSHGFHAERPGAAVTRLRAALFASLLATAMAGCAQEAPGPTATEADAFVTAAEARLGALRREAVRTAWLRETLGDTETVTAATAADRALTSAKAELARGAARFDGLDLPEMTARKLTLLKTAPTTIAPHRPPLGNEMASLVAALERTYGAGAYCVGAGEDCVDRTALERTVAELRDTDPLLELWTEGRALASSMRSRYARLVEIANAGAVELGHADAGERWRSAYGLPPDAFRAELNRLWGQVRPLVESLHCLVRRELGDEYGTAIAPPGEAIPAHLLGDLGDGSWSSVYDLTAPRPRGRGYDPTRQIERNRVDPTDMVHYGERFFRSLGFEPLPATFRERSRFVRAADSEVPCRPRVWNLDGGDDLRVTMCLEVSGADFAAVHRVLTRTYYERAYRSQDLLFRTGANDFFPAAIGDAVALAVTPAYLVELDLLDRAPAAAHDVPFLLRRALGEIPALAFALVADRWRWQVFSGEVGPDRYNRAWWTLREAYQGVRAPLPRSETDFDPGAAQRIPANEPYVPDFLARILQYQFHGALCAAAGDDGPLHRCSIFGSAEAGARLRTMMETGASAPWPVALEAVTGSRRIDASALLEYFAPLVAWMDEQNAGRSCGW